MEAQDSVHDEVTHLSSTQRPAGSSAQPNREKKRVNARTRGMETNSLTITVKSKSPRRKELLLGRAANAWRKAKAWNHPTSEDEP